MTGYVICASCGARIKANRERCLRCDEPLRAAAPAPAWQSPDWLKLSQARLLMAGAVASLAVLLVGAALWETRHAPVDDVARPVPEAPPSRSAAKPPAPPPVEAPGLPVPVTALDSIRSGGVAFVKGDFQAAKLRYEQALEKKPDDTEALNGLGQALVRLGQLDEATRRFTRAIELAPDKWPYHFNLAHVLGQQAQWDRAIAEYRIAARLFPTDYATQYNLAMALHKKGDDQAAIPEFQKAIELAPSEPSFHLSLGISLEKLGKIADAEREYQQFLEMDPSAPEAAKLKAHLQALAARQPGRAAKPRPAPRTGSADEQR